MAELPIGYFVLVTGGSVILGIGMFLLLTKVFGLSFFKGSGRSKPSRTESYAYVLDEAAYNLKKTVGRLESSLGKKLNEIELNELGAPADLGITLSSIYESAGELRNHDYESALKSLKIAYAGLKYIDAAAVNVIEQYEMKNLSDLPRDLKSVESSVSGIMAKLYKIKEENR